mmetsp:Transcript_42132/g.62978  ORF Transcript_42132/g.62978 Transcript_42132/m.62978 type:complete len:220 (-) Transcript_42132:424-1083(-)
MLPSGGRRYLYMEKIRSGSRLLGKERRMEESMLGRPLKLSRKRLTIWKHTRSSSSNNNNNTSSNSRTMTKRTFEAARSKRWMVKRRSAKFPRERSSHTSITRSLRQLVGQQLQQRARRMCSTTDATTNLCMPRTLPDGRRRPPPKEHQTSSSRPPGSWGLRVERSDNSLCSAATRTWTWQVPPFPRREDKSSSLSPLRISAPEALPLLGRMEDSPSRRQ